MEDFWNKPDLFINTGSHMYGCSNMQSDFDRRGFVIEHAEYLLGRNNFNQYENKNEDIVIWGFSNFIYQLTKGSPNIFELLFAPKNKILQITDAGEYLLDNKNLFISKKQVIPIAGFAHSEWLKSQLKTKDKKINNTYSNVENIGKKRKDSYEKYGYSLKNAYHAVRLLGQGKELAENGFITFPRPDADLLIDIRSGLLTFERVEAIVEKRDRELMIAIDNTKLKKQPDIKKIDELYYDLISEKITNFFEKRKLL